MLLPETGATIEDDCAAEEAETGAIGVAELETGATSVDEIASDQLV
jgi:hypothetical protein